MNDLKLTLKMERGRLILEMPHHALDLEVDGKLQASYFLGVTQGPDDLREELKKATAAKSACAMLAEVLISLRPVGPTARPVWAEALRAGLMGEHRVINGYHVPPGELMGNKGMEGWQLGYAIRAAIAMSQTGKDPREGAQVSVDPCR